MRFAVIVFPGSNCDADCYHVIRDVLGAPVTYVWHQEQRLPECDAVILPGGFSYGDYLRPGAIARFAPVMTAVQDFARCGGLVLGICNGFQILCEAGLLPGALLRNRHLRFACRTVHVRTETADTPFTCRLETGQVLQLPIAHGEGNYYADPETLWRLEANGQIVFRYAAQDGTVDETANPNGSAGNIAGICNAERNVLGMMPHPERNAEALLGSGDGLLIFQSMLASRRTFGTRE